MSTVLSPRALSADADLPAVDLTADESTGAFLAALRPHGGKAFVFEYGDGTAAGARRVQPGYHVTEIRDAAIRSVDCGGGAAEAWRETVVQVWDVPGEPGARRLTVDKFSGVAARGRCRGRVLHAVGPGGRRGALLQLTSAGEPRPPEGRRPPP